MTISTLNRVSVKNKSGTFVVLAIQSAIIVSVLHEQSNDTFLISMNEIEKIIDDDIRNAGYRFNDNCTVVPVTFSDDELTTILKYVNECWCEDNPVTLTEVHNNPKLLKYFYNSFRGCSAEVVDTSSEAAANDWMEDINDYR